MNKNTKANQHIWVAIIAGGQGTRLFPISHPACPKQFCQLDENNTFIQAVIENFKSIGVKSTHIMVITTDDNQMDLARSQCLSRGVLSQNILKYDPNLGYAGSMVKAAEDIRCIDPEAVIINTPSDQYINPDESFRTAIDDAICSAQKGAAVIVGVKVYDIVTAMGCGHAIYDENDDGPCFKLTGERFVEKPDRAKADKLMRQGNSVCNTGINVWRADTLMDVVNFDPTRIEGGITNTDQLMKILEHILRVSVGTFDWHDCGTLKSLYEISKKTPNHKNASLGGGVFERNGCRRSLLYAVDGTELRVSGSEDDAVILTVINEHPIVVVAKLADSQKIKLLAEDYIAHKEILDADFSMGARNNTVLRSNVSDETVVGFVGVHNYAVYVHRRSDNGMLEAVVSQQLEPKAAQ